MVEWKTIGDICYISDYVSNGSFASLRENVHYRNEPDYAILVRVADYSSGFDASKFVYIDDHAYNFLAKSSLEGGEIIMSNVGSCGLLFRCPKLDRKMSLAPNSILIKSDYIDYLFYWLGSKAGQEEIKKITSKSAMPKFNKTEFKKISLPIPPLSEQNRIVGILDTFTSAIDNLKEQIAQRRKQYEYYRDQLLDLEGKEGVEMKTLREVCKLERGVRVVKKDLQEQGVIPVFQNSLTPLGFYEKSNYPGYTTFVICAGAAGEVGYSEIAFWAADDCTCIICPSSICSKYVYNYLMVKQHLLKAQVRKASVPRLSKDVIGKLQVPLPPLQEQQRIVSILDTFEASISNLEAQLKEREKQYEYYRNKLLTFE
jgi:type I restriction enzyme S subunit